jgi:hypothetical protein
MDLPNIFPKEDDWKNSDDENPLLSKNKMFIQQRYMEQSPIHPIFRTQTKNTFPPPHRPFVTTLSANLHAWIAHLLFLYFI